MLPPSASPEPKSKSSSHRMLFIFLFGLVLGIAIFSSYSYFRLAQKTSPASQNSDAIANEPATFNITEADHIWGAKDAPVTLVVFSDLACPYCQEYFANLQTFMKTRSDQVRVVWRHLPISLSNVASVSSAIASECAGEQGKFFEYLSALYPHQDQYSPDFYLRAISDLGLDTASFSACVESGRYDEKIKANFDEAVALGVEGSPASFLNGRYLAGALTLEQLESLIDPLIR